MTSSDAWDRKMLCRIMVSFGENICRARHANYDGRSGYAAYWLERAAQCRQDAAWHLQRLRLRQRVPA